MVWVEPFDQCLWKLVDACILHSHMGKWYPVAMLIESFWWVETTIYCRVCILDLKQPETLAIRPVSHREKPSVRVKTMSFLR